MSLAWCKSRRPSGGFRSSKKWNWSGGRGGSLFLFPNKLYSKLSFLMGSDVAAFNRLLRNTRLNLVIAAR